MAITVKHTKVSSVPDSADTSLVRPSDWNADHTLTGLGTMAEQNANNVTITGGSISGATVSGYIPTTEKGAALGVATLDAGGKVPTSQIPLQGDLNYQGAWNASTNSPTLTSSVGTQGYYYVVNVAGTTNLNGITDWQVGDWAIYNGTVWQKVDNTDAVTSVNGQVGTVVLGYADVGAPSVSGANATGTWAIDITGNAATATKSTNLANGSTGQIAYQSAPNTTAFVTAGTSGQVLSANAGGIPTWITNTVGDVVGPSSATDNAIARFDTTTGKLIQNSVVTIDDTGNASGILSEQYTPQTAPSYSQGLVWYDSTAKALAYYNDSNGLKVHVGQDLIVKVINNTGSTIANGSPVYITSTSSGQTYPNVALAKADVAATSAVIGLTNGSIANGATGYVTSQGGIDGVNTGSFTVGQVLYLSPYSAGQLMNTIPPTGITVQVGVVSYVDSSAGKIYVKQTTPLAVPASIITGTLPVSNGGTGATTLTGYVKGSGTSAMTASSTIPTTDLSGTITNAQLANSTITINGNSTALGGSVSVGTVTAVTATAPVASTGGTTPVISMAQANVTTDGYLSSTDWNTFNNKQPAGSYLTAVTADAPLSGSGTSGSHLVIATANTTTTGALSSTDWNTFNGKANAFTYTSTYIPYGQGTTTPNQSSSLTFDGTTQTAPIQRASNGLVVNSKTVSASYTIASGDSAMSAGPITVASGQSVTISSGSRWVVL